MTADMECMLAVQLLLSRLNGSYGTKKSISFSLILLGDSETSFSRAQKHNSLTSGKHRYWI